MKTDTTICLNSKVDGKQPSLEYRIYDSEGISTALTTSFLPNIAEPCVLTPKRTDFGKAIRKQYEAHEIQISRHDMTTMEPRTDGITNTLTSVQKDNYLAVPAPISVAMRGRNPNNPSERGKSNGKYKQRLEMNESGMANALTSVQKDSVVAEPLRIPEATSQGYAEAYEGDSVNLSVPNSKTRRGRVGKQMANTLDTGCQQGVVVSDEWKTIVGNKQMNPFRGSINGESPCITSACGAGGGMTPMLTNADVETTKSKEFIEQMRGHQEMHYRIRKLTPRECFRLMGVDDADIGKIQASGVSNSQQYKLAGNSIVVDVLYHIFRKAFCEMHNENQQQTLF